MKAARAAALTGSIAGLERVWLVIVEVHRTAGRSVSFALEAPTFSTLPFFLAGSTEIAGRTLRRSLRW